MKYIRTEDGIINVEKDELAREIGRDGSVYYHDGWDYQEKFVVLKESDSIEELCDEFVEISPYNSIHHFYSTFNEAKMLNHCGYVFGMNWVFDKNNVPTLKAVAKINVTGELELL